MKFTAQSIARIIKTCRENSVAELKLGDFYLSFKDPTRGFETDQPATIPDENSQNQNINQVEFDLSHERDDVEDDEAMMLLNDPEEFESRIGSGDLVNEEKLHN